MKRRDFLKCLLTSSVIWSGAGSLSSLLGGCDTREEVSVSMSYALLDYLDGAETITPQEDFVRIIPMSINGEERRVLFEHPPTEITFPKVPIYRNARLCFGAGISEIAWDNGSDGVLFEILLKDENGHEHSIYSRFLGLTDNGTHRRWFDEQVDLRAFDGRTVAITFRTLPGPSGNNVFDWAGWSEPRITYEKRVRHREARHVNVLLISIDTLRADHLGYAGFPRNISPTLDALSRRGVRFMNAIAQATTTLPSHMSILTSLYPSVHGVSRSVRVSEATISLPKERTTITEVLKKEGYFTAAFVDGGWLLKKFGYDQGFDIYDDTAGHITKINKKMMDCLKQHFEEKFFLFMHVYDVHGPYEPPAPYDRMFYDGNEYDPENHSMDFVREVGYHDYHKFGDIRDTNFVKSLYAGGVRYVDSELNKLFALMEDLRIFDNTLIILLSDHGESLFEHHVYIGHGMFLYDTEVRIPLLIKAPNNRFSDTTVMDQIQSIDVMPTVLDLLDLEGVEEMQGKSLTGCMGNQKVRRGARYAFGETPNLQGTAFVRTNRWKYVSPLIGSPSRISEALKCSDRIDLTQYIIADEQLYDLEKDPLEQNNVAEQETSIANDLRQVVHHWEVENTKLAASFDSEQGKSRAKSDEVRLSEEEQERLRALGYAD